MKTMAGKLRNRITIQVRGAARGAYGQPSTTAWTTFATVWARIVSVNGSENFKGQQFSPEVTHEVTIRWLDGITPMHRVLTDDGKILDILYANYGERKIDDQVILICKERIGEDQSNDPGSA